MKPDDSNAPHADSNAEASAPRDAQDSPRGWRRTRNKVLAGIGAIITTVIGGVILAVVVPRLPAPVHPQPTSPRVTHPGNEPNAGAHGMGWSLRPTVLANDYLTVTASMQPDQPCLGATGWVFRQPPRQLAPLPWRSDPNSWALRNGGIPQSGNYLTVTVQGNHGHTVVILAFGVKVLSRSAPPTGTAANLAGGCGGLTPSFFDANLDKPDLQVKPVAGLDAAGKKVPAVPLPHTVSESSPEQWHLRFLTATCDCIFVPYFTWSSDGNVGTFQLTNGSGQWRVAATVKAQRAIRDSNGQWKPY